MEYVKDIIKIPALPNVHDFITRWIQVAIT